MRIATLVGVRARSPSRFVLFVPLRRAFVASSLLLCLTLACGQTESPRRVVLITIDTLRADRVGCYGAEHAHTPTLDALAARGVRFDTAISPVPLTLPSHASILTGLDPPRHGVHDNTLFRLSDEIPTLAERARAGGLETAAFVGALVLDRQYGLARGFDLYDDRMSLRRSGRLTGFAERRADRVVDAALAWLEGASDSFFLWVHLYDPHAAYDPPPGFKAAFPDDPYAGEIAYADAQLGRLLAALDARWTDGRTLIVATSDHGESLGEHHEPGHGYTVYEATQRVPLLIRGPGFPAGRVVEPVVRLVDLAPTVLGALGLAPLPEVDGLDLGPLVAGKTSRGEVPGRIAYVESLVPQFDFGWSASLGLRSDRYKYIRTLRPELYDLVEDPDELNDISRTRPALVAELDRVLEDRLADARPIRASANVSDDQRLQLESLGYLVPASSKGAIALGVMGGPDPKDMLPTVWKRRGEATALMAQGRPEEALKILESIQNGGWHIAITASQAAIAAGEAAVAERFARKAIALEPGSAYAHSILGRSLEEQRRTQEAAAAYRRAMELDPASAEGVLGLGRVAEAEGDLHAAQSHYSAAVETRGASPEALWRLAALHIANGRSQQAEVLLEQFSPAQPLGDFAVTRLAVAEFNADAPDLAIRRLQQAIDTTPHSADLQLALAQILEAAGQPEAALRAYRRADELAPGHPVAARALRAREKGDGS